MDSFINSAESDNDEELCYDDNHNEDWNQPFGGEAPEWEESKCDKLILEVYCNGVGVKR